MQYRYKESGYVLGYSSNYCDGGYDVNVPEFDSSYFNFDTFDHEGQYFSCDPNHMINRNLSLSESDFSGPFSIFNKCLYKNPTYKITIDYAKKFWSEYKENRKYLHLNFADAHEGT